MNNTTTAPEVDGLKARLKATWTAGDYDRFSRYMEQGARIFYEQLDVPAGCQLLDVACGSGWSERHRRRHRAESSLACTGARKRGRPQGSFR